MIDFTKWNQVTSGNVHSLVVVVCCGERQDGGVVKVCRKNYDCLAQKTENLPVKQTFSYVKTAFLKLWSDEVFRDVEEVVIWSDGGQGTSRCTRHNDG